MVTPVRAYWEDMPPGTGIPSGVVVEFDGLIANIPAGFVICDGNNGTVNRLTRFPKQVDTAITEAGTTGGATNKTTAGHSHLMYQPPTGSGAVPDTGGQNIYTDSKTDTIADIRPLYIDTLYIMKT